MSDVENLWRNRSSQSMKSTRRGGYLASKRRSGCSATLFSYCAGITIMLKAKLPIYQKPSMVHKVKWHLRLLRQLKCITALKTPSKPQNYTDMTLLTCWVEWHQTWRIFTRLCITKINFSRCLITQETLEMQPKKAQRGQPIGRCTILQIQILGILYPNVPWSCRR